MARYRDATNVTQIRDGSTGPFALELEPGAPNTAHGIFRCIGCGREIALPDGHRAPPQNHHQHTPSQGAILWRLLVLAA